MSSFQRVLVGLDFSSMDDQLVEYTAFLCGDIRPEKIIFLHAQHDPDVPDSVLEAYPVLREPLDEQIRRQMADTIRTHFPGYEAFDIIAGIHQSKLAY